MRKLFVLPALLFSALSFGVSSSALAGYNEGYNNPVENSVHTTTDSVKFADQGTIDAAPDVNHAGSDIIEGNVKLQKGTGNAVDAVGQDIQDLLPGSADK